MQLKKITTGLWWVYQAEQIIATIHLDFWHQVDVLVFHTKNDKAQRQIKELVLSHDLQYVKNRDRSNMILIITQKNNDLTESDSDRLMNFYQIPEKIKKLSDQDLNQALKIDVLVIQAKYETFTQLLNAVVAEIKDEHGVEIGWILPDVKGLNQKEIEIAVAKAILEKRTKIEFIILDKNKFTFWKSIHWSPDRYERDDLLHIIPAYHPEKMDWQRTGLINGATDAFIGSHEHGLDYIYCPQEAQTKSSFGTSWNNINHPYYAQGRSMTIEISTEKLISQRSFDLLKNVILSALNLNKTFIEISGGFYPPYTHPCNASSIPYESCRGSENSCVWEYRQLEQEGQLADSIIPPWFHKEGWLDIYAGQ